jgi:hypothetical protein
VILLVTKSSAPANRPLCHPSVMTMPANLTRPDCRSDVRSLLSRWHCGESRSVN